LPESLRIRKARVCCSCWKLRRVGTKQRPGLEKCLFKCMVMTRFLLILRPRRARIFGTLHLKAQKNLEGSQRPMNQTQKHEIHSHESFFGMPSCFVFGWRVFAPDACMHLDNQPRSHRARWLTDLTGTPVKGRRGHRDTGKRDRYLKGPLKSTLTRADGRFKVGLRGGQFVFSGSINMAGR